jgi:hypothetical protein
LPGFDSFDKVLLAGPRFEQPFYPTGSDVLRESVYESVPLHSCEVPVDVTPEEWWRFRSKVGGLSSWSRSPVPFINARYQLHRSGTAEGFLVISAENLSHLMARMVSVGDWMELENSRREHLQFVVDDCMSFTVEEEYSGKEHFRVTSEHLAAMVAAFLGR